MIVRKRIAQPNVPPIKTGQQTHERIGDRSQFITATRFFRLSGIMDITYDENARVFRHLDEVYSTP